MLASSLDDNSYVAFIDLDQESYHYMIQSQKLCLPEVHLSNVRGIFVIIIVVSVVPKYDL